MRVAARSIEANRHLLVARRAPARLIPLVPPVLAALALAGAVAVVIASGVPL